MTKPSISRRRVAAVLVAVGLGVFAATSTLAQSSESSDERSGGPAMCSTDHDPNYVEFAEKYLEGKGDERVPERAVEVLTNGCDREDAASCDRLADLYEKGVGVEEDADRAQQLRERAESLRGEESESGS